MLDKLSRAIKNHELTPLNGNIIPQYPKEQKEKPRDHIRGKYEVSRSPEREKLLRLIKLKRD
jgi:hypothetical protein